MRIQTFSNVFKIIAGIVIILIFLSISYQYVATKLDEQKYLPIGSMVDMNGYKLHMIDSFKDRHEYVDGPTIILESGYGGNCLGWSLIQPEIAKFARVVNYDRAGYGWSDESPLMRSGENIATELHTMLHNAGILEPYILVAHSRGGIYARLFAEKYPQEVVGVVLVDTRNENQMEQYPPSFMKRCYNYCVFLQSALLGYCGYDRLLSYSTDRQKDLLNYISKYSPEIQNVFESQKVTAKFKFALAQEELYFGESCYQLRLTSTSLHNKPLTVITAGKPFPGTDISDDINTYWRSYQADLVTKSLQGKQIIAEQAGHDIPYDQPEIIVDAVREMIMSNNNA